MLVDAEIPLRPRIGDPVFQTRKKRIAVPATVSLVRRSVFFLAAQAFARYLLCFRLSVRLSAIMAMNSEFVGLPLMFDTV